jgi:hypothetical protein
MAPVCILDENVSDGRFGVQVYKLRSVLVMSCSSCACLALSRIFYLSMRHGAWLFSYQRITPLHTESDLTLIVDIGVTLILRQHVDTSSTIGRRRQMMTGERQETARI